MSDPVLLTDGPDTGLVSHMRNPIAEQRLMVDGGGSVELSNREVLAISGVDRLGWLHSLTSQFLDGMEPGALRRASYYRRPAMLSTSCTALMMSRPLGLDGAGSRG